MIDGQAGDALRIADRLVALLRDRAGEAEAEVTVTLGHEALTRFATSFIHQNVANDVRTVSARVALGGRTAAATRAGATDDAALERFADGLLEAARVSPEDPGWPGLAPVAEAPDAGHWDDATAAADPAHRARGVEGFVAAADGLETAGSCSTAGLTVAFANTGGQRLTGRTSSASLDGICRTGTSDGSAREASVRVADLDGRRAGSLAARKARDAAAPTDLEPGRYQVVLEPASVANVVQFLLLYGFNARAVEEGRSFVRVGETQFDAAVTLVDDVADPGMIGIGFDTEGTPKRPLDLVRDGTTAGLSHDRRTAAAAGTESTGHAWPGSPQWGPIASHAVLAGGGRTTAELVASMERGVLVTDLWYTRVLDPRTLVVTGLTRNGVWLVEDGQVVRPVSNLRFTQSFVEALAPGAVLGASSDRRLITAGLMGAFLVPSLHLRSWNFTGGARG